MNRKNGVIKGRSYEYISELDGGFVTTVLTTNAPKLETVDKRHEALKNLVSRLNRHLESVMNCRIGQITVQAVFNFAGAPHILSCRSMSILDAPSDFIADRDKFIFVPGCEPQLPSYATSSLLLPMKWGEHGEKKAHLAVSEVKDLSEQLPGSVPEPEAATEEKKENPSTESETVNVTSTVFFAEDEIPEGINANSDAELLTGNSFHSHSFTPSSSFNKLQRVNKTPSTRRSKSRAAGAVEASRQRSPAPASTLPTESSEINIPANLDCLYIPNHISGAVLIPSVADIAITNEMCFFKGKAASKINYENKEFQGSAHLPFQGSNTIILKEEMRNQRMKGKSSMFNANLTTMHALSKSELDLIIEKSVAKFRASTKEIDQTLICKK